jgi:hypothetical protein
LLVEVWPTREVLAIGGEQTLRQAVGKAAHAVISDVAGHLETLGD